jgi:hypothetical protein
MTLLERVEPLFGKLSEKKPESDLPPGNHPKMNVIAFLVVF